MQGCSLNCGELAGVSQETFESRKGWLDELFTSIEYDGERKELNVCGARHLPDDPKRLTEILDSLSLMLDEGGKGMIMLKCEATAEVCYFRPGMWKLESVMIPADPFDGVHKAG